MRKIFTLSAFIVVAISVLWTSCAEDNLQDLTKSENGNSTCDTSFVLSYSNDVVAILGADCYSCHNKVSAPSLADGNVLDDYNSLVVYVESGSLLCVINHGSGCPPMPDGDPKISDCKIARIDAWINQGYPNN